MQPFQNMRPEEAAEVEKYLREKIRRDFDDANGWDAFENLKRCILLARYARLDDLADDMEKDMQHDYGAAYKRWREQEKHSCMEHNIG